MSDNMTPPVNEGGNAMSLRQGIQALQATRNTDQEVSEAARTLANARNAKQEDQLELPVDTAPEPDESVDTEVEAEAETEEATVDDQVEAQDETLETEPEYEEAAPETNGVLLTLDDGTQLTKEEIKKGFLRESDYTRKTQKLATERRAVESEAKARLARLDAALASLEPEKEPNWEVLAQEDPDWNVKKLQYDKRRSARDQAVSVLRKEQEHIMHQQKKQAVYDLQSGSYLTSWKDPKVFQNDLEVTSKFAVDVLGFSLSELDAIADPRAIQALDMARRLQDQVGKIKTANKKVANKPRAIKAGRKSGLQSGVSKNLAQAQAAFNKNPTKDNAKAIFAAKRSLSR